jgi:hypothetical protein
MLKFDILKSTYGGRDCADCGCTLFVELDKSLIAPLYDDYF